MSNISFNKDTSLGSTKGIQPQLFGSMIGGNERSLSRKYLNKAFGNLVIPGLENTSPALYNKNILGPFRTHFNAGDVIVNTPQSTNKLYGKEANLLGGNNLARVNGSRDGLNRNGNAMYSGNPKFIHDSSDYIRFKKLQAINRNFNDHSFGGANYNNTQSVIKKIRS